MKYKITLNDKVYEVEVEKGEAAIVAEYAATEIPTPAPAAPGEGESLLAPMPGTILSVNVKAGDSVKAGQVEAILEAMMMENELLAPVAGTVARVGVQKGATVNTGDLIAVIG